MIYRQDNILCSPFWCEEDPRPPPNPARTLPPLTEPLKERNGDPPASALLQPSQPVSLGMGQLSLPVIPFESL